MCKSWWGEHDFANFSLRKTSFFFNTVLHITFFTSSSYEIKYTKYFWKADKIIYHTIYKVNITFQHSLSTTRTYTARRNWLTKLLCCVDNVICLPEYPSSLVGKNGTCKYQVWSNLELSLTVMVYPCNTKTCVKGTRPCRLCTSTAKFCSFLPSSY